MSKYSGREKKQQKSHCKAADQRGLCRASMHRGVVCSLFMLLALVFYAPGAKAQSGDSMENWQNTAFSAIDMRKRLDALGRQKTQQESRNKKQRRATAKRRRFVKPTLKRVDSLKKSMRRKAQNARPKKKRPVKFAGVTREPAKLQRCLQKAGYFKGVITGRLDDATLLSYLAFRDDKKLKHRPNNLYDPEIQRVLFALCPDDSLSKLNQIVASAMGKKQISAKASVSTPAPKTPKIKTVKVEKTVIKKPVIIAKAPVTKPVAGAVPKTVIRAAVKKQSRLPAIAMNGKKTVGKTSEASFASDVLAGTSEAIRKAGKGDYQQKLAVLKPTVSPASSSFAVKRSVATNTAHRAPGTVAKSSGARVASYSGRAISSSSSPFSSRLSIADLAKVQPVNQNTCSPQKHEPVVAMSRSSIRSTGSRVSKRGYDDGPIITGAISSSSSKARPRLTALKSRSRLVQTARLDKACLPRDLYDLLATTHGRKTDISVCKQDCLPAPKAFSQGQKELFAEQYDINWCGTGCLGIADPLPLREVMKIEREARVHVCMTPQVRMTSAVKKGLDHRGINTPIRALYNRLPGGFGNQGNIAVLIGNRNYGRDLQVNDAGHVNVSAMKALLIEQLGYSETNVIVVKDARRDDFVRLFGRRGHASGELQRRLKANPDAQLMIYYSGHASSSGLGMNNYLLPVDTVAGIEDRTAYSLGVLYDNLRELDARTTQLFLEAGFNANRSHMVLAPNIAERRVNIAPIVPVRGLAIFSAATGDQKPLIDHETGIGLFTRYLISGLAGAADQRPIGNSDRIIDSVELHVHLASNVRLAARKTLGLRQNPTFSRSDNLFLSQLSRKSPR